MEIDPALISVILTLISAFTLVSKVRWLVRIGKWLLLATLIYAVIFIPALKDFFVAILDTVKHALNQLLGSNL